MELLEKRFHFLRQGQYDSRADALLFIVLLIFSLRCILPLCSLSLCVLSLSSTVTITVAVRIVAAIVAFLRFLLHGDAFFHHAEVMAGRLILAAAEV